MYDLPSSHGKEILRVEVGSTLHGTGLKGGEDHDEMGIFLEFPSTTIGLDHIEHYEFRTAEKDQKSKPGDTDLIIYSMRKWCALALKGNPSVLLPLYAPKNKVIINTDIGKALRKHPEWFASKRAGHAFLGYMERQRARMQGKRGKAGRIRNMPDGNIDWKYAMHMLRLGYQGIEFMESGQITLPIPGSVGEHLRKVRRGSVELKDVIFESELMEAELKSLLKKSPLPDEPNKKRVNEFCVQAHLDFWKESGYVCD
jgi:predicted nucleotidyltransferase